MSKNELKRSLGLVDATSIVAGSMIGSGIFIVTATMMRDIGSPAWMLLLWLLTGIVTIFAALSYGELASMMPNAGGQYVYIRRAYGRMTSFIYGWSVFTVIQTGLIAAVAVAFAKYTAVFFPFLNNDFIKFGESFNVTFSQLLAVLSIIILTFVNSRGVKNGKVIQVVFTSAKLFALFALIVIGIAVGIKSTNITDNFSHMWEATKTTILPDGKITVIPLTGFALLGALGATIINPLFSSDAWNNVTFIAGEIKNPKKNIPRSLFLGTLIVTVIYILANLSYLLLLPNNEIMTADQDRVGAAAASVMFGNIGASIMAILIMVSTFGCNNGLIFGGSRLFYAMSVDGLFFKKAKQLNKYDVPSIALWIQCIWSSILCMSGKYSDLLVYSTFTSLLFYMITIAGVFILRIKEPNTERPYKAFGYPIIPALYILITLTICADLLIYDTRNTGMGLVIVLIGIPIFYLFNTKEVKEKV